jgi:DtxR family Mn-dependent transcriptional regulator
VKTAISVSKEDYLKAILEAESEGRTVISATLAHWLEVSPPAVSMALRRLKRDGFVEVRADGVVRLTPKGHEAAYKTALRHHLIERMLSEMFGRPWYEVHDEAERLEHAVSPAFEALLMKKLGEKGTCPHGNAVLPESEEKRKRHGVRPLADVAEGTDCTVTSLYERDEKLLRFLNQTGIEPGGAVRVVQRNYDQTLGIETAVGHFTIGPAAAEKVRVKRSRGAARAGAAASGNGSGHSR